MTRDGVIKVDIKRRKGGVVIRFDVPRGTKAHILDGDREQTFTAGKYTVRLGE